MLAAALLSITGGSIRAQLNPMGIMYYMEQYTGNASFAGIRDGLYLSGGIRQQWDNIPGAPRNQVFIANYGIKDKRIGLGINLSNEQSGLIKQTRALATYAYHLSLGDRGQDLNLGLSLGFLNNRIDQDEINGNPNDDQVYRYNNRQLYIDGDFGISYTSQGFTLQGSLLNLKNVFKHDDQETANRNIYSAGIGYRWNSPEANGALSAWSIEPKVMLRGLKGNKNIADAGAQLRFAYDAVNLMAMYHSTDNATFGFGMNFRQQFEFMAVYTTETSALSGYTNGNFEIGLRAKVF